MSHSRVYVTVVRTWELVVQSVEDTGVGVSWYKTSLPQGTYQSSWGEDGVKEVAKQFAGDFTLKSGGQVTIPQLVHTL